MFVYAVTNHKGGVGKTTAAATLGAAFAGAGRRVLLLDLDPQASLTAAVGACAAALTIEDVLASPWVIEQAMVPCASEMWIVPARATLAIRLHEIMRSAASSTRIALALRTLDGRFDTVLIDCPSVIGAAMTNALTAANAALVPIQCDFLSLRGLADIQAICNTVVQTTNPYLEIRAFANMYDRRTTHAWDVLAEARQALGPWMLDTLVPRNVRLAEAPATGKTVLDYAPKSSGAVAYQSLAQELMEEERNYGTTRRHSSSDSQTDVRLDHRRSARTAVAGRHE
jgi:chromosome partitioning protein